MSRNPFSNKALHPRIYSIWSNMKTRCSNPSVPHFGRYGGRGIKVCDEWIEFEGFRDWALANGYEETLSLDRRDNDGPYEPGNCRWATAKEQGRNCRKNILYPFKGNDRTIPEIAEMTGIKSGTLWRRVRQFGMSIDDAISTPIRKRTR